MEISLLSFINFLSFEIFLFFTVFILYRDPRKLLNQITAIYLSCFTIWSAGMFFINNPATTKEGAILANKLDSIGWISFPFFFLWFVLVFTKNKKVLAKKYYLKALFIPTILLIIFQWQGKLIYTFEKTSYGWSHVWSDSIFTYIFYIHYILLTLVPIFLLINFYRKSTSVTKRKQAKIIIIASIIPLLIGSFTNVIAQEIGIHEIPSIADLSALVWSFGIVYAIVKYQFLSITPSTAAENIIETMSDALILTDLQGNISTVNKATLKLTGYNKDEIKESSLNTLFMEDDFKELVVKNALNGSAVTNYNLLLITKEGENVPVIFSNSLLKDKEGHIVGIICIAKDITALKKTEEQLEKRAWELETKIKELEKIQKLTVNREFKMMELKEENKNLYKKIENIEKK
ncbi:MAG: PAS domain S-box protein [Patescibacteria group bacterium]|jgi:PAS domain S-box-containing protein|nr:PAS domain S-box protein [Patescibacteria group bacterium]